MRQQLKELQEIINTTPEPLKRLLKAEGFIRANGLSNAEFCALMELINATH